eukprot:8871109-Ditylum_brightwellii.AAC.1
MTLSTVESIPNPNGMESSSKTSSLNCWDIEVNAKTTQSVIDKKEEHHKLDLHQHQSFYNNS